MITDYNHLQITDPDFEAEFDGNSWTVSWQWINEEPIVKSHVSKYLVKPEIRADYEAEIDLRIEKRWLSPTGPQSSTGILPLMAVQQEDK